MPRNNELPPDPWIGAALVVISRNMALHEVTADNFEFASTISLLRARARYLRATCRRMWIYHAHNRVEPFLYDSEDGSGSIDDHFVILASISILMIRELRNRARILTVVMCRVGIICKQIFQADT